jgi:hypothetical protein
MPEITQSVRRFLDRVTTITVTPWTGKLVAMDDKGRRMRLSKATFERLKEDSLIIRSTSSLATDTYIPQDWLIVDATIEAEIGNS